MCTVRRKESVQCNEHEDIDLYQSTSPVFYHLQPSLLVMCSPQACSHAGQLLGRSRYIETFDIHCRMPYARKSDRQNGPTTAPVTTLKKVFGCSSIVGNSRKRLFLQIQLYLSHITSFLIHFIGREQ